jgi:hypothetical protein
VAVTRDGRVFQMGSTGAYNPEEEKGGRPPAWEGCLLPTQVGWGGSLVAIGSNGSSSSLVG